MSYKPQYEADELLAVAKMEGCPVLIVEGHDDISIYKNICSIIDRKCDIFASENLPKVSNRIFSILNKKNWMDNKRFLDENRRNNLKDFQYQYKKLNKRTKGKEGCIGVINAIKEIEFISKNTPYEKYVMGIIDRDTREFRNEMESNLNGLFVLQYYSIESHFVNKDVIPFVIDYLTDKSKSDLSEKLISDIFSNILDRIKDYYYLALECLKNACDKNYQAVFSYSPDSIYSHTKNTNYSLNIQTIMSKQDELDTFAFSKNITNRFEDILLILKGKWILELFIDFLFDEINSLKDKCKVSQINKCQYCIQEDYNKCLYKVRFFHKDSAKSFIFQQLNIINEFEYIKMAINNLEYKS